MSGSTTCDLCGANLSNQVIEHDHDSATCDSSLTICTITGSHGGQLAATCNSKLQYPANSASTNYAAYFCVCGGKAVSVPSIVNCADNCYDLSTSYNCNWLSLYDGFTAGNSDVGITQDVCSAYRCDSKGVMCTTDGFTVYNCDNEVQDAPAGAPSTQQYVCNCNGAAAVPEPWRTDTGKAAGTGCGGAAAAASTPSNANPSTASSATPSPSVESSQSAIQGIVSQNTGVASIASQGSALQSTAAQTAVPSTAVPSTATQSAPAASTNAQPATTASSSSSNEGSACSLKRALLGITLLLALGPRP